MSLYDFLYRIISAGITNSENTTSIHNLDSITSVENQESKASEQEVINMLLAQHGIIPATNPLDVPTFTAQASPTLGHASLAAEKNHNSETEAKVPSSFFPKSCQNDTPYLLHITAFLSLYFSHVNHFPLISRILFYPPWFTLMPSNKAKVMIIQVCLLFHLFFLNLMLINFGNNYQLVPSHIWLMGRECSNESQQ